MQAMLSIQAAALQGNPTRGMAAASICRNPLHELGVKQCKEQEVVPSPLLEGGGTEAQHQLGPVLAAEHVLPGMLHLLTITRPFTPSCRHLHAHMSQEINLRRRQKLC